jgi:hypothetical protein
VAEVNLGKVSLGKVDLAKVDVAKVDVAKVNLAKVDAPEPRLFRDGFQKLGRASDLFQALLIASSLQVQQVGRLFGKPLQYGRNYFASACIIVAPLPEC